MQVPVEIQQQAQMLVSERRPRTLVPSPSPDRSSPSREGGGEGPRQREQRARHLTAVYGRCS